MFEKDAENYRLNLVLQLREKTQQGYDCQLSKLRDLSDIEVAWQKGAEFGYAKANEWHRIDEGKYPNKESLGKSFIVAFAFNEKTQEYYSFDCAEYIDKEKFITHTSDGNNKNNADKIIAWKEITFSKDGE